LESVDASKGVSALEDPILIVERKGRVGVSPSIGPRSSTLSTTL